MHRFLLWYVQKVNYLEGADMAVFQLIRPEERVEVQPPIPGVKRETALADENSWVGYVTTEPGMDTGWHHHGGHDTYAYIVKGQARIEWGPGGEEGIEGGPGTFGFVPRGRIHREINTGDVPNEVVIVRIGSGPPVIPADGPEAE